MFKENQSLLAVSDLNSSEWRTYTDYVDHMILAGFSRAIQCSLQYLLDNTDPAQRVHPLFEVQLVLNGSEMCFNPPLDLSERGNFFAIVDKMLANILNMASFIPRVAKHTHQDDYQVNRRTVLKSFSTHKSIGDNCFSLLSCRVTSTE